MMGAQNLLLCLYIFSLSSSFFGGFSWRYDSSLSWSSRFSRDVFLAPGSYTCAEELHELQLKKSAALPHIDTYSTSLSVTKLSLLSKTDEENGLPFSSCDSQPRVPELSKGRAVVFRSLSGQKHANNVPQSVGIGFKPGKDAKRPWFYTLFGSFKKKFSESIFGPPVVFQGLKHHPSLGRRVLGL